MNRRALFQRVAALVCLPAATPVFKAISGESSHFFPAVDPAFWWNAYNPANTLQNEQYMAALMKAYDPAASRMDEAGKALWKADKEAANS